MKIIKMGKLPLEKRPVKTKCNYCDTVFEYDKADVKFDQRDGNYVICPNQHCSHFLTIK